MRVQKISFEKLFFVSLFLFAMFIWFNYPVKAAQDGDFSYEIVGETVEITGYTGEGGKVVIPSELGGYPVKKIGGESMRDNLLITNIIISEGIEEIGGGAFYNNSNLQSIVLPESLTIINNDAFENCMLLEEIKIPKNVNHIFSSIINGMYSPFRECRGLKKITVAEDNLTYKSVNGVLYNKEMTELIRCPGGMTDMVIIPSGIITIGDSAFAHCFNLPEVRLPDSLEKIGPYAFQNCNKLTNFQIPEKVETIGEGAFWGCWLCTGFFLPPDLTEIEDQLFYDCRNLTEITMHNKIESIGNLAFARCKKMEIFVVPIFIKSMGAGAFNDCSNLSTIQFNQPDTQILTTYTLLSGAVNNNIALTPAQTKIVGYKDSTAENYTKQFGNEFQSLGDSGTGTDEGTGGTEESENCFLTEDEGRELFKFLGINQIYTEDSDLFKVTVNKYNGSYNDKVLNRVILYKYLSKVETVSKFV